MSHPSSRKGRLHTANPHCCKSLYSSMAMQAMVFTDQVFCGHLGTEPMAAAALGNMCVKIYLQYT